METAIAAARRAFDETNWSTDKELRAKCLRQIHEGLVNETEQLRAIVTAEAGAPVALSSFMQIDGPIEHMAYWAEKAASFEAESEMSDIPFFRAAKSPHSPQRGRRRGWRDHSLERAALPQYCQDRPGVGFRLHGHLETRAGHALAGHPSGQDSWRRPTFRQVSLNIVASSDHMVGEALSTDPRIDLVTFTGSTATGKRIMSCAADTVKKVFLELRREKCLDRPRGCQFRCSTSPGSNDLRPWRARLRDHDSLAGPSLTLRGGARNSGEGLLGLEFR